MVKMAGMYKDRLITSRLKKLVKEFPVVVVIGARQVGKSTLIDHVFGGLEHITFDPVIDIGYSKNEPDIFLANHPAPVILDEIQYAPELLSAIKRRVDKNRVPGQYILTGSQQWAVMKNIAEGLTGRAVFLHLEGFCLSEIAQTLPKNNWLERWLENDPKNFRKDVKRLASTRTLYEQLWRGWLPEADRLDFDSINTYYQSYMQTYVERDVRQLLDTGNWQIFGRFLQLVSALTGQEINFSKWGKDLDISYQTVQRWLAVIEGTFQWFKVPAYSRNLVKKIRSKPKGYIADTGLACSLNRISSPDALGGHPITGALFETAVASEIRKLSSAISMPPHLYHWRTKGGAEVDLILERDGILFPIEIKITANPTRKHTTGFDAFRKTYPKEKIAPGLVICPTEKFEKISENDYAMPWDMA
jgi:predicted AAA+ superfamily ATPase